MTQYKVLISSAADKTFEKMPRRMRGEVEKEISLLSLNPYTGERLTGPLDFLYSYHFTVFGKAFRAAYTINTAEKKLTLHYIGPRGGFYERLKRFFKL